VPKASNVSLKIFDVLGNEILTLVNEFLSAGNYEIDLSAMSLSLTSGIYFYRLNVGGFVEAKKMILLH
jgi:enterochelin esterase family protein